MSGNPDLKLEKSDSTCAHVLALLCYLSFTIILFWSCFLTILKKTLFALIRRSLNLHHYNTKCKQHIESQVRTWKMNQKQCMKSNSFSQLTWLFWWVVSLTCFLFQCLCECKHSVTFQMYHKPITVQKVKVNLIFSRNYFDCDKCLIVTRVATTFVNEQSTI